MRQIPGRSIQSHATSIQSAAFVVHDQDLIFCPHRPERTGPATVQTLLRRYQIGTRMPLTVILLKRTVRADRTPLARVGVP